MKGKVKELHTDVSWLHAGSPEEAGAVLRGAHAQGQEAADCAGEGRA